MQPETIKKPRYYLTSAIKKILQNGTLEENDGATILIISKRTPASRPATMATNARYLCNWLNKRFDDSNRILEYPDYTNKKGHQTKIRLCDKSSRVVKHYLKTKTN